MSESEIPTDRMAKAREARAAKRAAAVEETPTATIDAAALLDEMRSLRRGFDQTLTSLREENADLKRRIEEVGAKSSNLDEHGVAINALPPNFVDLRENRPGTLEEKLNAHERAAKRNKEKDFDRERTRRILLGLPVQDLNPYICSCGKGFAVEAERDACMEKHTADALAHMRKRVG